jgi:hypothetical protein
VWCSLAVDAALPIVRSPRITARAIAEEIDEQEERRRDDGRERDPPAEREPGGEVERAAGDREREQSDDEARDRALAPIAAAPASTGIQRCPAGRTAKRFLAAAAPGASSS